MKVFHKYMFRNNRTYASLYLIETPEWRILQDLITKTDNTRNSALELPEENNAVEKNVIQNTEVVTSVV